jgi:hypothetical protein
LLAPSTEELRRLIDFAREAPSARPLADRVVAVLPMGPITLAPAAWLAAAGRLGATVLRLEDLDPLPDDPFDTVLEAARWADLLVTSHSDQGFARAAAQLSQRPMVNAGEGGGEDPAAGVSLLAAMGAGRSPLRVAVCGDLATSRSAAALLAGLAGLDATTLLVPAQGAELGPDGVARLGRRMGGFPHSFAARSMSSLLDMVDTVLLTPEAEPQLPLFEEIGVPPDEAVLRVRRQVEELDYLFVAARGGGADRLVAEPFRSGRGGRLPTGAEHRTHLAAVEAVLRFAAAVDATAPWSGELAGALERYRASEGAQCRGSRCVQRRFPDRIVPDFAVVGRQPTMLECLFCGERTPVTLVGSRVEGRYHPLSHGVSRKILADNRVLFRDVQEARDAGFEAPRWGAGDAPGPEEPIDDT